MCTVSARETLLFGCLHLVGLIAMVMGPSVYQVGVGCMDFFECTQAKVWLMMVLLLRLFVVQHAALRW